MSIPLVPTVLDTNWLLRSTFHVSIPTTVKQIHCMNLALYYKQGFVLYYKQIHVRTNQHVLLVTPGYSCFQWIDSTEKITAINKQ
jgi:hypothetical protein